MVVAIITFFAMNCFNDSVGENPNLFSSVSCTTEQKKKKKKKTNIIVPIVASVGGLFLLLAAAGIFWIIKKTKEREGKTNTSTTNQG